MIEANLEKADLSGASLSNANLKEANLKDATLRKAHLDAANFSKANLEGADLSNAHFWELDLLKGANLQGVNLDGVFYKSGKYSYIHLKGTYEDNLDLLQEKPVSKSKAEDLVKKEFLQKNEEFINYYRMKLKVWECIPEDSDLVYETLLKHPLVNSPSNLRSDRELVLASLKGSGNLLYYASKELRADKEVVLTAIREDGEAINSASETLKLDKDVVLTALKNLTDRGAVFSLQQGWVDPKFKHDRDFIIEALKQEGYDEIYKYLSEEFKDDKEITLVHWLNNSLFREVKKKVLSRFKGDKDVQILKEIRMIDSVCSDGAPWDFPKDLGDNLLTFKDLSDELLSSKNIVCSIVRANYQYLKVLPINFQKDKDIILAAIESCYGYKSLEAMNYASDRVTIDGDLFIPSQVHQKFRIDGVSSESTSGELINLPVAASLDGSTWNSMVNKLQNNLLFKLDYLNSEGSLIYLSSKATLSSPQMNELQENISNYFGRKCNLEVRQNK